MEKNILLTGAGGNVCNAVLKHLPQYIIEKSYTTTIDPQRATDNIRVLDLENTETFTLALRGIKTVFLLRPPHISDVKKYFAPFINTCKIEGVSHIVFLSVQGAEKIRFIPHAKIESIIQKSKIPYTFIRPSYFMQNLSTTLKNDIKEKQRIFLPAGKTPFLWIDVMDIGKVISVVLSNPEKFVNTALTLTGSDLLNFDEVAELLSKSIKKNINYINPGLLRFFMHKKREGCPSGYILVLIMLHFFARFQALPEITSTVKEVTGSEPNDVKTFIEQHKDYWI
ncbi:MAG: NmrA family NAD(P)-binding protein [Cytophagaceae bacterium]